MSDDHRGLIQEARDAHLTPSSKHAYELIERLADALEAQAKAERTAAAKALRDAAEAIDNADDLDQFKNRTPDAPNGWTDEGIEAALMASGVLTDWLRARAERMENE